MRILLDIHTHLVPVDPARLALLPGVEWKPDSETLVVDGRSVSFRKLFHPEALIQWMDESGIDVALVSVPPPLYRQHLGPDEAAAWTIYLNEGLDAIAAGSNGRLVAMSHLPTEHPGLAATIAADRAADNLRLFAAPSGGGSVQLSDALFDPLWQVLADAGAFLFLHPIPCHDPRLQPFYLENLIGNPYELAVAAAHLAFAGVPDRHPDLTICLANGGGAIAMASGRMKRAHEIGRPGIDPVSSPDPLKQLRRLFADCLLHDPAALTLAASTFGRDNIVFGSDWPFPLGLLAPREQLATIDDEFRRRIFLDNPGKIPLPR